MLCPKLGLQVHVDTNSSGTYATAILYLSTLPQPGGDGATVFPLAAAAVPAAATPTTTRAAQAATGGMGGLPHAPETAAAPAAAVDDSAVGAATVGDVDAAGAGATSPAARSAARALLSEHVLHTAHVTPGDDPCCIRHADLLVGAAGRGHGRGRGHGGLSIYPEAGKLVLFFTRGNDGEVDPMSFHGGAKVGELATGSGGGGGGGTSGNTDGGGSVVCELDAGKWILQICKEVPPTLRGKVAMASFVSQQRAFALEAAATKSNPKTTNQQTPAAPAAASTGVPPADTSHVPRR